MKASCRNLGRMDYKVCWDLQQSLFAALLARKTAAEVQSADSPEPQNLDAAHVCSDPQTPLTGSQVGTVLLVEHPPVYTLGKSGHSENLLIDREGLERLGATFYNIDRGGDITFHGPGQLVCYPILDLEQLGMGLRAYIEALEEAVIRTVAVYGIDAGRIEGASGVWITGPGRIQDKTDSGHDRPESMKTERRAVHEKVNAQPGTQEGPKTEHPATCDQTGQFRSTNPRKICAIGVRSSRYITMHGFALNVSTDLKWFSRINPCGFTDKGVTSIEREVGQEVPMDEVKALVVKFLGEILNVRIYK